MTSHSSRPSFRALAGMTVLVLGLVASGCSSTSPKSLQRASSRSSRAAGVPNLGPLGIEDSSLGAGPADTREPVVANPRSWMYDTFWGNQRFRTVNGHDSGIPANQVELGQIAIPGSHDSTTYEVGDYAAPCNDLDWLPKKFGKGMTERWARTQHYDLYRQATLGIRSFDLRIYYDGHSIRTCHTLDAASLDDAIRGDGGLNRFVKEQPLEPVILNLSHYKAPDGHNGAQWTKGLENLIGYLKANVCDQAVRTTNRVGAPRDPARLSLLTIAEEHKNYVVVADDENGLYQYLAAHGVKDCVFRTNMTGGYAEDHDVLLRNGGGWASTNLWLALARAFVHELRDPAALARDATQQVLIDGMSDRTPAKLHETSYIWVVGPPNKDGTAVTLIVKQKYGDDLLQMTEKGVVEWNSFLVRSGEVEVGLLEHGADFIRRLDERARELGTNVNIVNMDAVGDTPLTSNGFIRPLLELNARMVW